MRRSPLDRPLMLLFVALAVSIALAASGRHALLAEPPDSDPRFDRLSAFVAAKIEEYGIPGVAFGVLADGAVRTGALGVTNVDHPLPVTPDTLFQVGSISKTFTGTAVMRLVDEDRLDLHAPVRRYIPEFRVKDAAASRGATVFHLLTHMGGWEGDVFEDTGQGDDALAVYVAEMAEVEQGSPLAEIWSYNNAGFAVAGRIVEIATGRPFEDALRELVLEPLDLAATYVHPADVMTLRYVSGHRVEGENREATVLVPWPIGRYAHSMGGVISTVPDLLRYARFHIEGDGGVMSDGSREAMQRSHLLKQGMGETMGLTWHIRETGGLRLVSHGGSTLGQQALLTIVPERRFAVALLTNANNGSRLNRDVTRRALEEYFGVQDTDPVPLAQQPDPAPYVGRYSRSYADVIVDVDDDGRLTVQTIQKRAFPNARMPVPPPGPKLPVAFHAPDRLVVVDGPQQGAQMQFLRRDHGAIGWIRVGSRVAARQR
jgi:CubicO group peptidase (beta-lactamase class C family)